VWHLPVSGIRLSTEKGMVIKMENKDIRELAGIMNEMGLTVLDLEARGVSIRLERAAINSAPAVAKEAVQVREVSQEKTSGVIVTEAPAPARALPAAPALHEIKSPTVGTFYAAPDVDKEPFVTVGSVVSKGQTLCLLEAMKMLNEITADRAGVIAGIPVQNKQVVEFGQTLFSIDTSGE